MVEIGGLSGNKDPDSEPAFETDRRAILAAALPFAAFDGFTPLMLRRAAADAGVGPAGLAAAFPAGALDLLAFWSSEADAAVSAALAAPEVGTLKVRAKVSHAITQRIAYLEPHKEAARRAAAMLALPPNAARGAALAWKTADAIWRALGDRSTDANYYSKRAILSGVWLSTAARWFADDDAENAGTLAFLARRIDNVMEIERLKAVVRDAGLDASGPIRWLAGLRYPSGR